MSRTGDHGYTLVYWNWRLSRWMDKMMPNGIIMMAHMKGMKKCLRDTPFAKIAALDCTIGVP